jgi:predicted GNAT family acetyltransferase
LWDISIDTLAGYRNKGYAAACVAYMIELMRRQKKQPVWGSYETNEASLRLAAKLGFVAVDTIMVLQRK